jgi:arginine decarboxylase
VVRGMSIEEMLALVQYFPNDLHRRMQVIIREQQAVAGLKPRVGVELLNRYDALFRDNTYMEKRRIVAPQED